jgi:two-component system cell cycle sensor histidine kinase/response regulator CckA
MAASLPAASLRRSYPWLPVLIVGVTIVAFVIGVVMLRSIEVRMVEAMGENLTLASAEISDKLDRLLFERHGDVRMMARTFGERSFDKKYVNEYLQWVKETYEPVYLWLGVTDAHGRMVAATDSSVIGQDYSRSGWFDRVRQTGTVRVDEVEVHESNSKIESVAFTAPIMSVSGQFLGAVTTRVGLPMLEDVLIETVREIQQTDGIAGPFEYQFLTKAGIVFVDSAAAEGERVNLKEAGLPSVQLSRSGKAGYVEETHARRHVPVVTGYAQTNGYSDYTGLQWTILLQMDRDVILLPIRAMMWKLGMAGVVVWIPMVGLLLWATGRLREQHRQAQQESEWARAAEAALLQSQERNRVIVDSALDAVISMDAGGIITDWNAQAINIFGWEREEALGRRVSETVIPVRDREAHERGLRHFPGYRTGRTPQSTDRDDGISPRRP